MNKLYPPEILFSVFDSLDSFPDTGTARLICRQWNAIFKDYESTIVTKLVRRLLALYPEARVAEAALCEHVWTVEARNGFAKKHLQKPGLPPSTRLWTWATAHRIAELHEEVEWFTEGLIHQVFDEDDLALELDWSLEVSPPPNYPITRCERIRIIRAFYRFELYNIMWPEDYGQKFIEDELRPGFFSYFSMAEINQLSCVWMPIYRALAPSKGQQSLLTQSCADQVQHTMISQIMTSSGDTARLAAWSLLISRLGLCTSAGRSCS